MVEKGQSVIVDTQAVTVKNTGVSSGGKWDELLFLFRVWKWWRHICEMLFSAVFFYVLLRVTISGPLGTFHHIHFQSEWASCCKRWLNFSHKSPCNYDVLMRCLEVAQCVKCFTREHVLFETQSLQVCQILQLIRVDFCNVNTTVNNSTVAQSHCNIGQGHTDLRATFRCCHVTS